MDLTYNDVDLGITRVVEMESVPEFDPTGLDYLWTRHRLTVEAVYSPQQAANGWKPGVSARGDPLDPPALTQLQPGSPVLTRQALHHRLSQPRGVLVCSFHSSVDAPAGAPVGDATREVFLTAPGFDPASPGQRLPCDCKGGPFTHDVSVSEVLGDARTLLVRITFETFLTDCRPSLAQAPLQSNRWTCSMSYDGDGYCTRKFVGLSIFREDLLKQRSLTPDDFRLDLLPPVPPNTKRVIDRLEQHPDGAIYAWEVSDVEQPIAYADLPVRADGSRATWPYDDPELRAGVRPVRNVRSISCVVRRRYAAAGAGQKLDAAADVLADVARYNFGLAEQAGQAEYDAAWNPAGAPGAALARASRVAAGAVTLAQGVRNTLSSVLPQYQELAVCTVRGNRLARKADLVRLAYSVAFSQLSTPLGVQTLADLMARYAAPLVPNLPGVGFDIAGLAVRMFQAMGSIYPPASVLQVEYDAFDRWVRVTVEQEFSALLDWVLGGQAGGFKAVTGPVPDTVLGVDWPSWVVVNGAAGNGPLYGLGATSLTRLPDAGNVIAAEGQPLGLAETPADPTALSPPVVAGRMGTNLSELVAAGLTKGCTPPYQYRSDRTSLPTAPKARPTVPVPPSTPGLPPAA